MKKIWTAVNDMDIKREWKKRLFVLILVVVSALTGGLLWLAGGRLLFQGYDWMLCFMGYPAVFVGLFGGILYLYNHDFA